MSKIYNVTIGEYGLGDITSSPKSSPVYYVDADDKTIQKIEAYVTHIDSYVYETIDIGEVDMVVQDFDDIKHLIEDEGYRYVE